MPAKTIYSKLVPLLIEAVPRAVQANAYPDLVYCLRVYYDSIDTPQEGYATRLRLIKEANRARVLATTGANAPYYIWCADETDSTMEHGPNIFLNDDPKISKLCGKIYERLCNDEEANLPLLRGAIQEVCRALNQMDWRRFCEATDDFVVFPADGSHTFYDDYGDLVASVPAERVELLRSRGLLGPAERWDQL
jgi:hypothetical protein